MDNFIFNDDGVAYITLFGFNYMNRKASNLKYLPEKLKLEVAPTLITDVTVLNQTIYSTMDGDVHITADIICAKGKFRVSTEGDTPMTLLESSEITSPSFTIPNPTEAELVDITNVALVEPEIEEPEEEFLDVLASTRAEVNVPVKTENDELQEIKEVLSKNLAQIESKIAEITTNPLQDALVDEIVEKLAEKLKSKEAVKITEAVMSIDAPPKVETLPGPAVQEVVSEPEPVIEEYTAATLPDYCYDKISAFSLKRLELETVLDDNYCIKNKWEHKGDFYVVDIIPKMQRFVHSDALKVNIAIDMKYVRERKNG